MILGQMAKWLRKKVYLMGQLQESIPLIELKSQKIVKSIRGKEGGYLLNKAPEDITFGEILRCIHGDIFEPAALGNNECPQALKSAWEKMQSCLDETADSIHFRAIMEEDNQTREMYYI